MDYGVLCAGRKRKKILKKLKIGNSEWIPVSNMWGRERRLWKMWSAWISTVEWSDHHFYIFDTSIFLIFCIQIVVNIVRLDLTGRIVRLSFAKILVMITMMVTIIG